MPDTSVPPCMPLVPFKIPPWCWSSEGVSLNKLVCEFFKRDCLGLQKILLPNQSHWFLQPEFIGTCLPGIGTLGWGIWCGAGTLCSWDIPFRFLSTTCVCGTSLFCISAPLTRLGCGFFNCMLIRLPLNLISAFSEWWLLHYLVRILMWLCEEASRLLCCHLDWKEISIFRLHNKLWVLKELSRH